MKSVPRQCVMIALGVIAFAGLSGCPSRPVLTIQPASLTLSDAKPSARISIINDGGGTLVWTAQSEAPWLMLSLAASDTYEQSVAGSTSELDIIQIALNSELLPEQQEPLRTVITFASNGGDKEVNVAVDRVRTPVLRVVPDTLDFGEGQSEKIIEILNTGDAVLQWQIELPESNDWLTVNPMSGAVTRESAELATVRILRERLVPSDEPYQTGFTVLSNGGDAEVAVTAIAPAFSAAPAEIDFGLLLYPDTQLVSLTTQTDTPISLTFEIQEDGAWLDVDPDSVTLTRTQPRELRITANPVGLDAGDYETTVHITHEASGHVIAIPVFMAVAAPAQFRITPESINFGETRQPVEDTITIINEGDSFFEWRADKPSGATWLQVTPTSGMVEESAVITLRANPARLTPGAVTTNINVWAGASLLVVPVSLTRLPDIIPDALQVEPRDLDFGNLLNQIDVTIWNEGPNPLTWMIDEEALPAWLTVTPNSGAVSGEQVQTVRFFVDRNLTPDEDLFGAEVLIQSDDDGITPVTVRVTALPRRFPQIEIIGEGIDGQGVPFIMIDIGQDSETFTIRNLGNAELNWSIDLAGTPSWITSVAPSQGQLRPGREQQVRITTNRAGLNQSGGTHRFVIRSNDPDMPTSPLEVSVRVPFSIVIGAQPATLNFGRQLSTRPFEVANLGDPGRPLDFVITSNHPDWIFVEPERGRSVGTTGTVKDWQIISVAIDRGRITRQGAAARLFINAENVPPDAAPVNPVEVPITVDIPELTIETSFPGMRPPSLLRFNLLFRDAQQRIFPAFEDDPLNGKTLYRLNTVLAQILEDSVPLELSETNVFVKKDESLQFAVMIVLDFSKSMLEAAQALVRDGQLEPAGRNPLDALYIETIGAMVDEFPEHYKVGLAVFNERRPWWTRNIRPITGAPPGYSVADTVSTFVSNKEVLRYRLENMDVQDYGATPLYEALWEAGLALYNLKQYQPDFDRLAERFLVAVTDGRRTTPPGDVSAVTDLLSAARIRFMPIGFGKDVIANPLIQISSETGGHYYATDTKVEIGGDGRPVDIPLMSSLMDRCRTDPDVPDAQSLPRDLRSHIVLSYVSLNEESAATVQGRITVEEDDPPVQETFIVDQVPMLRYANEVRMGQIGMRTQGIQADNSATVSVYADYVPRGINHLRFVIATDPGRPWTVQLVPQEAGGLISNWTVSRSGDELSLVAPTGREIAYGDYGNLFDIQLSALSEPVVLFLELDAPRITAHQDSKFFTLPASIPVDYESFQATSFPNPALFFEPTFESEVSNVINLGDTERSITMQIINTGGEHLPTDAALYWRVGMGSNSLPGTMTGDVEFSYWKDGEEAEPTEYYLNHIADTALFEVLADEAPPGVYSIDFYVEVNYGSLFLNFVHGPYYILYEVL